MLCIFKGHIQKGRQILTLKVSKSVYLTLFSLGVGKMCPHRSNCPKTQKNEKKILKSTNKITLREMQNIWIQSFFEIVQDYIRTSVF